ncbi:hypothetical protein F0Q53_01365 [Anaplasma marginale]|uniref:Uncharacterized protein n=1 Tax=Anaplasma marginale TaxID=770 RepID=A0A643CMA1_ANAMA|nr:hypothetical protein AM1193 [Anaplasma marginale str. St. Maries]AXW84400.1 hypothetical protein CQZ76_04580 [Anaplasma marginale]AXW85328.1 hypothetical protein BKM88_04570 [Anaplasma marginale]KAA8472932.1 hypothetical protein F0Q58_01530 [Anaplasma marginale]KAA8475042.1 hypothetical protein F0Q53_01365 [Anaplasma marginale]
MQQHPSKICKNSRVLAIITTEDMSDLLAKTHDATKTAQSSNTRRDASAPELGDPPLYDGDTQFQTKSGSACAQMFWMHPNHLVL